jgi:hypothetical protein
MKKKVTSIAITLMTIGLIGQTHTSVPTNNSLKDFMQKNHIAQSSIKQLQISNGAIKQASWFSQIFGRDESQGITMIYTDTDGCTITSVQTVGQSWLWGPSSTWTSTVECN